MALFTRFCRIVSISFPLIYGFNLDIFGQTPPSSVTWTERGPINIAGRTRAILFDPTDPTHRKVWAGSAGGGIWSCTDITTPNTIWTPAGDAALGYDVMSIVADPTSPSTLYAATGDAVGEEQRIGGGIWKTTNAGQTWSRLVATIAGGSAPAISKAFDYVERVSVNSLGHVFAGTQYGVVRSTDGGATWQYALAPQQNIGTASTGGTFTDDFITDLELADNGQLFAALRNGRLFRSADGRGDVWVEITPVSTAPYVSKRTEMALSRSVGNNSPVLYAISVGFNSYTANDVRWFKKSTDSGVTWTDVSIPQVPQNNNPVQFTVGGGFYNVAISVDPTNPNIVYAGGGNFFGGPQAGYRSADGGATWTYGETMRNFFQLLFRPDSPNEIVWGRREGVFYLGDAAGQFTNAATIIDRNNQYRTSIVLSTAMAPAANTNYLLGGMQNIGWFDRSETGGGIATAHITNGDYYSYPYMFIDSLRSSVQLVGSSAGTYSLFNPDKTVQTIGLFTGTPAAYAPATKTLYSYNGSSEIRTITDVGATNQAGKIYHTSIGCRFMRVGPMADVLFCGSVYNDGGLYKISNLTSATAVTTRIDNGTFPTNVALSCIEVGADNNELLVTFAAYGGSSVRYTRDGGQTWVSKDETGYGLPDMPVYWALFNPKNRKQVLLATERGVYMTNDITAANPAWQPANNNLPVTRCNQLTYRPSDGRVAVSTHGRGVWTTNALAAQSVITLTGISATTLCAGSTFTVSFSAIGSTTPPAKIFSVYISDAVGSFDNAKRLGGGTASPLAVTLPGDTRSLLYGTNYRVKIVADDMSGETAPSTALTVGNLTAVGLRDRFNSSMGTVCPGSPVTLSISKQGGGSTLPDRVVWYKDGAVLPGVSGLSYTATQPGAYSITAYQVGCVNDTIAPYWLYNSITPDVYVGSDSPGLICTGQSSQFTADYLIEAVAFQWQRDGSAIVGATTKSYTATQTGNYSYRVTDGACQFESSASYLQVGQSVPLAIALVNPSDTLRCIDYTGSAYLYFTSPTLRQAEYQFKRNGIAITEPSANLYFTAVNQPGLYTMVVKQGSCETISNSILIRSTSVIPTSISYTGSLTLCPGTYKYFSVPYVYGAIYQWQKDGVDITNAVYNNYYANEPGKYNVRVQQGTCQSTSVAVQLMYSNTAVPKIGVDNGGVICGGPVNVYLDDDFYGGNMQWQRNGLAIPNATNYSVLATEP